MTNNLQLANVAVNAEADALSDLLDAGYLRLFSGTQPATADTPIGPQVLLAELRFSATSAPGAVAGELTFNPLLSDLDAKATGTATWYRAFRADGTSAVLDGSVGTADADLVMKSVEIQTHAQIDVTSFSHTIPKN